MAIPAARTAARHDDQAAILEIVSAERPVEKRNPVQQLEADLADPWPDDNGPRRLLESLELPADGLDRVAAGIPSSSSLRSAGITRFRTTGILRSECRNNSPGRLTASNPDASRACEAALRFSPCVGCSELPEMRHRPNPTNPCARDGAAHQVTCAGATRRIFADPHARISRIVSQRMDSARQRQVLHRGERPAARETSFRPVPRTVNVCRG